MNSCIIFKSTILILNKYVYTYIYSLPLIGVLVVIKSVTVIIRVDSSIPSTVYNV